MARLASLTLLAIAGMGNAHAEMVGPWNVVSYPDSGPFEHCIMARGETSTPAPAFTLGTDHAAFAVISKSWKFEKNQTLKAKLTAGQHSEDFDAIATEPTVVAFVLTGRDAMTAALRAAHSVSVTLPIGTFQPAYDGSAAAFVKLDECLARATHGGGTTTSSKRIPEAAYAMLRGDCEQDQDKDRQIAGCSAVIESGREAREITAVAYSNRGFGYSGKSDWDRAIADFGQAIQLNPSWPNAHWGRGDAFFQKSDFARAIADYTDSIRLTPSDASLFRSRALARFRSGDAGAAIEDYTAAIKLAGNDATLYVGRADVYASTGDVRRAGADYDAALRINPSLQSALDGKAKLRGGNAAAPAQPATPSGVAVSGLPPTVSIEQYSAFIRDVLRSGVKTEVDKDGNFIAYPSSLTRTMLIARRSEGSIDDNLTKFTEGLRSGCQSYGPNEVVTTVQTGAVTARRTRMTCKIDAADMVYDDVYIADASYIHIFVTFGTDRARSEVYRISGRIYDSLGKLYH